MASLNYPYTFTNGTTADANQVMSDLNAVKTFVEGSVVQTDGSVQAPTAAIADGAITSAKIADLTIASGDIADSAITTAKLQNGSVTYDKIAQQVARGLVALAESTASTTINTNAGETQIFLTNTFTAGASRRYKITWYEPQIYGTGGSVQLTTCKLRLNSISGDVLQESMFVVSASSATATYASFQWYGYLPAGTVSICATCLGTTNGQTVFARYGVQPAVRKGFLIVEDIG